MAVDRAVDCQHARLEIIAEVEDLSTLGIHSLWQVKLTVSQTVLLPEYDLRIELTIDLAPSLETSHVAAIGHEANRQFKSLNWGF